MSERKTVYFSNFVQEEQISTVPNNITEDALYRFKMTIPFKERNNTRKAIVIMKNPSKAGKFDSDVQKKISDETIYRVTDYLYKHEQNFSKVIILNLFSIYSSIFDENVDVDLIFGNDNMNLNNNVLLSTLEEVQEDDRVIVAWGGYPKRIGFRGDYRSRIKEVEALLDGLTLWRVGELVQVGSRYFPQHGLNWYDFEELKQY
jgi:hypothetical protein